MQIQQIIKKCSMDANNDQFYRVPAILLVVRLHDDVHDHSPFGFTHRFDQVLIEYIVEKVVGPFGRCIGKMVNYVLLNFQEEAIHNNL